MFLLMAMLMYKCCVRSLSGAFADGVDSVRPKGACYMPVCVHHAGMNFDMCGCIFSLLRFVKYRTMVIFAQKICEK